MSLIEHISNLDEKGALKEIKRRVNHGEESSKILKDAHEGLKAVGRRFNSKEYALIELEMADQLFKECVKALENISKKNSKGTNN